MEDDWIHHFKIKCICMYSIQVHGNIQPYLYIQYIQIHKVFLWSLLASITFPVGPCGPPLDFGTTLRFSRLTSGSLPLSLFFNETKAKGWDWEWGFRKSLKHKRKISLYLISLRNFWLLQFTCNTKYLLIHVHIFIYLFIYICVISFFTPE